ncbi:hypothetical protein ACHAXM_006781 [Skeletonema potamos]|jgi:hypothetical protein
MAAAVLRSAGKRLLQPPRTRSNNSSLCHWLRFTSNFSSDASPDAQPKPNSIQVPPLPSWSVSELRLSSIDITKPEKISEEELATLARRCLIDVRRLSPERRDQLCVDIAGIMRCASVLLDSKKLGIDWDNNLAGPDNSITDQEVYDNPRGLGRTPLRRSNSDNDHGDEWQLNGSRESKAIMNMNSVKSKMVVDDDERFFSVVTKR